MTRLTTALLLISLAFGLAASQTKQKASSEPASAMTETTVIHVPTVVCSSCVKTITKALNKVPGVKTTSIDLKKKTATVMYAATKVSVTRIEEAISKAGYDANGVKRDSTAYDNLDACCKFDSK